MAKRKNSANSALKVPVYSYVLGSELEQAEINSAPLHLSMEEAIRDASDYSTNGYHEADDGEVYLVEIKVIGVLRSPKIEYTVEPV